MYSSEPSPSPTNNDAWRSHSPIDFTTPSAPIASNRQSIGKPSNRRASFGGDEVMDDCCCYCCQYDPVLIGFQLFHILSAFSALAAIAANLYVCTQLWETTDLKDIDSMKDIIIRACSVLFCVLIVVVEGHWNFFYRHLRVFESWWIRSFWSIFVGILTSKCLLKVLFQVFRISFTHHKLKFCF